MAAIVDAVVGDLANQLVHFVEENASLTVGIKGEIEELLTDLKKFGATLKQASKNEGANDNDVLKDALENMRNLKIDAEDAISKYTVEKKKHKDKGLLLRYLESPVYYARVNGLAKEIQAIKKRVAKINQDNAEAIRALIDNPNKDGQPTLPRMAPVVEEEDVVGFAEEAKIIKNRLINGSENLTFISIKGMAGLGKTTLTKMVFKDRDIQHEFFTCIWVYVSRTFNRKLIFLDILSNFKKTKEFHDMFDDTLSQKIQESLGDRKYFIVMDDVWTVRDWDYLKIAFPNNMKGSRVLVTTRHEKVASHVDSDDKPHQLKFLTNNESWELLAKKVFRKERCPPPLEAPGKRIAIKCKGLPLAIVVIAGVLDKNSTANEWNKVAEDPFPVIGNQENQSYYELVKLSYDHLPFHLKDCFLYLGVFPIGHEIDAWKLIRMWIAEGFIPAKEGGYTSDLERTGEKSLEDLIDRNLLMVLERRADTQIKTCRIHDTLHEFCKIEAARKNLFHEMDEAKRGEVIIDKNTHRLCVNSSIMEFFNSVARSKSSGDHVRSFLSSCSEEIEKPNECLSVITKSFPLLRVMDVENHKFKALPKQFYELCHLRFLAVSTELKILPKLFSNLQNMQTLVFNTTEKSLDVKAGIWSMPKLRHVHTNTSMQLPLPPNTSKNNSLGSTEIKTLSTISPSSCTSEILDMTPDLQKLGIRGNLVELMENKGGICLFDNIQKLDLLENLKLIHNALQGNKLRSFPRAERFPRRLRKMTLSNTAFDWKDFNILGLLDELEVLKLKDNAFRGELCEVRIDAVFRQLQYLRIERVDMVSWTASKHSFPVLKYLFLRNCTKLDAVPPAFGDIDSLKLMELYCTNKSATQSALEIHQQRSAKRPGTGLPIFQLSIYPPYHQDVVSNH